MAFHVRELDVLRDRREVGAFVEAAAARIDPRVFVRAVLVVPHGGGDRADFRDVLLVRSVETGDDGRATVTFDLSDDLTSWHVSAAAFGADLQAGASHIAVPVGLPFFVDATVAPEYLVSDRPTIALRAFGSALEDDDPVTFDVRSDSLGLRVDDLRGEAFQAVAVPLPTLTAGEHRIMITATTGSGDARRTDRLTRTISVVTSRLAGTRTSYLNCPPSSGPGTSTSKRVPWRR